MPAPGLLAFAAVTGAAALLTHLMAWRASRLERFLLASRSDAPMDGRIWASGRVDRLTVVRVGSGSDGGFEPRGRFGFAPARLSLGGVEVDLGSAWFAAGAAGGREGNERAGWRWIGPADPRPPDLPVRTSPQAALFIREFRETMLEACGSREGGLLHGRPGAPLVVLVPSECSRERAAKELAAIMASRRRGWRIMSVLAALAALVALYFWKS